MMDQKNIAAVVVSTQGIDKREVEQWTMANSLYVAFVCKSPF